MKKLSIILLFLSAALLSQSQTATYTPLQINRTTSVIANAPGFFSSNSVALNAAVTGGGGGGVPTSRLVSAGNGLTGGGALSADVTISLPTLSLAIATALSDETGSGSLVFGISPSLTTPSLGAATATSINGSTIPTSKILIVTTDTLGVHASTSSAQLAGVLSDETGTGLAVYSISPAITSATLTTPTVSGAVTFPAGTRQTFAPNGITPGLNIGSNAGDPSTPSNGDLWMNSTSTRLRARINGASVDVGGGGQIDYNLTTITYAASIAVDINANQYQTCTLTGDATLTTANRPTSTGRAVTVFFTASGAQRIVTLSASWKNYGGATVTIPSGKEAYLTLIAFAGAETDVRSNYAIQP